MSRKEISKIIYNILWMTFDRVFVIVMGLFVTLRIINYYQISDYGIYQYAVSIIAILEMGTFFCRCKSGKKAILDI